MIETYNRKIPSIKTFREALHLAYLVLKEKADQLDKEDIHKQNLSVDHRLSIELLKTVFLLEPEVVIPLLDKDQTL